MEYVNGKLNGTFTIWYKKAILVHRWSNSQFTEHGLTKERFMSKTIDIQCVDSKTTSGKSFYSNSVRSEVRDWKNEDHWLAADGVDLKLSDRLRYFDSIFEVGKKYRVTFEEIV